MLRPQDWRPLPCRRHLVRISPHFAQRHVVVMFVEHSRSICFGELHHMSAKTVQSSSQGPCMQPTILDSQQISVVHVRGVDHRPIGARRARPHNFWNVILQARNEQAREERRQILGGGLSPTAGTKVIALPLLMKRKRLTMPSPDNASRSLQSTRIRQCKTRASEFAMNTEETLRN